MTDAIMTLDIAAIKARADKATAGGWIVIETTHPYKFTPSRPEFKGEGFHVERRIATAWDHPQLKDKYPLVNIATGIGTPESGAVHMCSIEADDADFIAHARTDIPALIAALEASEAARVKAEQERNALKDALTNSCNLLENYIDTFGDMSGANRADLNDYRRALEAKP